MSFTSAEGIGRTLARLSHFATRGGEPETDTSRDNILRILVESSTPMSIEDISAATGLHPNTIRTHLEVLRAAGKVDRTRETGGGRGRPKWLYSATPADDPYAQLAAQLATELHGDNDQALAAEAAARWRTTDRTAPEPADTPDEAVEATARSLQRLGFDVDVSPVGDAIYLGKCPYAELISEHPVICEIHARAVEQLLAETEQPVELVSVDVFPRPGVCVAHLRRADIKPARIVPGSKPVAESIPEQKSKKSKKSRRTR